MVEEEEIAVEELEELRNLFLDLELRLREAEEVLELLKLVG